MSKINTIYVDSDGVLCDWYSAMFYHANLVPEFQGRTLYELNNDPAFNNWIYSKLHTRSGFFKHEVRLLPDAHELLNTLSNIKSRYGIKIVVLTAATTDDFKLVESDKKSFYRSFEHIFNDVIVVPDSRDKYKYATTDSILIDDFTSNCKSWQANGGRPIHHISSKLTISQLFYLLVDQHLYHVPKSTVNDQVRTEPHQPS